MQEFITAFRALGFETEKQQIAAAQMIHFAGLLRGVEDAPYPTELISNEEAINFLEKSESIDAEEALDWLNNGMQAGMKRRSAERQQIKVDPRLEAKRDEIIPLLDEMGFISEVKPTKTEFDGALLLGAAQGGVTGRISELEKVIEGGVRPKTIYLLSGGRSLWPNAEALTAEFVAERIAAKNGGNKDEIKSKITEIFTAALKDVKPEDITNKRKEIVVAFAGGMGIAEGLPAIEWPNEMDMVRRVFAERVAANQKLQGIEIKEAFAPGERPTTEDTVKVFHDLYGEELIAKAKVERREKPDLLTISSQPHITYQRQPIDKFLPAEKFNVEMVGKGADREKLNIGEALDAFARRVYSGLSLAKTRAAAIEREIYKPEDIGSRSIKPGGINDGRGDGWALGKKNGS